MGPEELVVFLQLFRRHIGPAETDQAQGREAHIGKVRALHPSVDEKAADIENIDMVVLHRADELRVQEAEKGEDDRIAGGKGIVHHAAHGEG